MTTTSYEVHPAIGIARLGSSTLSTAEGYFIGPEPDGSPPKVYRDSFGFLKRQAARFRIFNCHRDLCGRLLDAHEATCDEVRMVTWTVHLANRKGIARRQYGSGPGFRNRATNDPESDSPLVIDPGYRSVGAEGERQVFDSGKFRSTCVTLGEIIMEPDHRLRVLGGYGRSGSDPQQPRLTLADGHFADNNDWFDDTSDGSVLATIELHDGTIIESQAWVIVGPPDYAPGVTNLVTLYDLLFDLGVRRGLLEAPADSHNPMSFTQCVRPILERALGYRWVNRYANFGESGAPPGQGFGTGDPLSFWLAMADPSSASAALRERVVGRLRNPDPRVPPTEVDPWKLMPRITDSIWRRTDPGNVLPLTPTQYKVMRRWAKGDFVNDFGRTNLANEPLPNALDRYALEACVGGPLYPGIEAGSSVLTDASRFISGEPFRLSHSSVRPGEVTQSNALPWQADFLVCRWEENQGVVPRRLGWWPAQRPDDVFPVVDATAMVPWDRGVGDDFQDMVNKWDRLGVVVDVGTSGNLFLVETERDIGEIGP